MKKIMLLILIGNFMIFICACGVNSKNVDYTDYFTIHEIYPIENETENMIGIPFEITNLGKNEDLNFRLTIGDEVETYPISPNNSQEGEIIIDIGKPNNYNLTYDITYEVFNNGQSIWTKEDSISYDCSSIFIHTATVTYGDEIKDIKLVDYQSNYFDLSEMFSKFDSKETHNVIIENKLNDIGKIQEDKNSEKCKDSAAIGDVLKLYTYGTKEINDTFHFTDNLIIKIEDAISATSVNWNDHLVFTNEAKQNTSNVVGMMVTTLTFYVNVENPSDEDIYGSITGFYVNDSAISEEYMSSASEHRLIWANSTNQLNYVSSGAVMRTTGVTDVKRLGVTVVLEDEDGNTLYDDILWLDLD